MLLVEHAGKYTLYALSHMKKKSHQKCNMLTYTSHNSKRTEQPLSSRLPSSKESTYYMAKLEVAKEVLKVSKFSNCERM